MREISNFNEGWEFLKNADRTLIEGWEPVCLPHTWNAEDGQDGGNDYFRGVCWYRKAFTIPDLKQQEEIWLEFRGVGVSAEVFLNGVKLCRHEGGYSTFRAELTPYLKEENLLEVSADNSVNRKVYPQHADFTFYGGIYRDVYLLRVPRQHFALDYYGGPGIKVSPVLSPDLQTAVVTVETWQTADVKEVEIRIGKCSCVVPASEGYARTVLRLDNVHLWNGREDPYLYTATALIPGKDQICVKFGCRSIAIDGEKGFWLNGKNIRLAGGARHQDRQGKGNALSPEDHKEDLDLLLEMGATAVRLAHYQHDQYFYDLCDENGLMAWVEIPYISEHMPEARENTITQMKELLVQNHHHAAVICWGLSNEITVTGGVTEDTVENHRILNDMCHRFDPYRPTVMAHAFMLDPESDFSTLADAVGWNLYYGWYVAGLKQNDEFLKQWRSLHPDTPVGLTEFGADANPAYHSAIPQKGDFSENYQCIYHEYMLDLWQRNEYLWILSMWNTFDFGADGRNEPGKPGQNQKGLVTFDRKLKKDAFYLYKAYLSDERFMHLCGSRYIDRTEETTDVTVYTTLPEVSLYVDGKHFADRKGSKVFHFQVPLTGEHVIEARSEEFSETIRVRKVEKTNPSYVMDGINTVNWFDDPSVMVRKGYFSIMDQVNEIRDNPQAAAIYDDFMSEIMRRRSKGDVGIRATIPPHMRRLMDAVPWENQLKQLGKDVNAETIRELNGKLNQIPKQ